MQSQAHMIPRHRSAIRLYIQMTTIALFVSPFRVLLEVSCYWARLLDLLQMGVSGSKNYEVLYSLKRLCIHYHGINLCQSKPVFT
jgi:hypothetical protein